MLLSDKIFFYHTYSTFSLSYELQKLPLQIWYSFVVLYNILCIKFLQLRRVPGPGEPVLVSVWVCVTRTSFGPPEPEPSLPPSSPAPTAAQSGLSYQAGQPTSLHRERAILIPNTNTDRLDPCSSAMTKNVYELHLK